MIFLIFACFILLKIKRKTMDQIMTIRNSMAHMQYGNFFSQENGTLILYWLYNKDDGIRKDSGIVFEFVLHELIQRFFNNYSSGLCLKFLFSKYSLRLQEEKVLEILFL